MNLTRFGDPEAQVLLSRLESDLMAQIVALDRKEPILFQWQDDFVVGVMLASKGYQEVTLKELK